MESDRLEFGVSKLPDEFNCEDCPASRRAQGKDSLMFITEWTNKHPVRHVFCKKHYRAFIEKTEGHQRGLPIIPSSNTGVNTALTAKSESKNECLFVSCIGNPSHCMGGCKHEHI
jgi:hypothetical protein